MASARLRIVIAAVIIAAMGAYSALRMEVTTDITHFLPAGSDHRMARLSRELADSPLTRTLILSIGRKPGPAPAAAATTDVHANDDIRTAAAALAERIARHPEVASVQRGPTSEMGESV